MKIITVRLKITGWMVKEEGFLSRDLCPARGEPEPEQNPGHVSTDHGQNHPRHGIRSALTTTNKHNNARFRSLQLGRWFPKVLFLMTSIYVQKKLLLLNLLGLLVDEWLYPHRLVQWTAYCSC